jgi:hypothetical protein
MKTINIVSIPKPMTDERLDEIYLLADIFAKSRRLDVIQVGKYLLNNPWLFDAGNDSDVPTAFIAGFD